MVVVLVAGHTEREPGAEYHGVSEHGFCREVVARAADLLRHDGVAALTPLDRIYREEYAESMRRRIQAINSAAMSFPVAAAVEVHLNAFPQDETVQYSLCLYRDTARASESRSLGEFLGARFGEVFQAWQSVRKPWTVADVAFGRDLWFLRETRVPAVIAEPCMLTQPGIASYLRDYRAHAVELLADALAGGIVTWGRTREAAQ